MQYVCKSKPMATVAEGYVIGEKNKRNRYRYLILIFYCSKKNNKKILSLKNLNLKFFLQRNIICMGAIFNMQH